MDELNDIKFIQQLKAGDQNAYKVLFDRMFPKLCAFISRKGVNSHDAEELTVDTMLKVHKAVRTFNPREGAKLTTWIFKIAENATIDYHRRPSPPELKSLDSEQHFKEGQILQSELTTSNKEPLQNDEQVSANILLLRRALDSLGQEDQDILRMRQVMSYEEIGQVQNTPVGTLRVRHSRAVERLRKAFEEERGK